MAPLSARVRCSVRFIAECAAVDTKLLEIGKTVVEDPLYNQKSEIAHRERKNEAPYLTVGTCGVQDGDLARLRRQILCTFKCHSCIYNAAYPMSHKDPRLIK
jgi:hypothetical protein